MLGVLPGGAGLRILPDYLRELERVEGTERAEDVHADRCFEHGATEERSNGVQLVQRNQKGSPFLRFSALETVEENSFDSVLSGTSQCVVIGPGASVIVSGAGARTALGRTQLRPCAFAW